VTRSSFEDVSEEYQIRFSEEQYLASTHASTHGSKTGAKAKKRSYKV